MAYSAENNSKLLQLNSELEKTSVISEQFKQLILATAVAAAEEAFVNIDKDKDRPNFEEEYLNRQFSGKASVRFKCRNMSEFTLKLRGHVGLSRGIGIYIGKYYPDGGGVVSLLTASYEYVVTVREWLWMEINNNPDKFAEVVGL